VNESCDLIHARTDVDDARDPGAIRGEANSAITISNSSFTGNGRFNRGENPLRVEALCTPCPMKRAQTRESSQQQSRRKMVCACAR